jgi:hypothetical protein
VHVGFNAVPKIIERLIDGGTDTVFERHKA